MISFFERSLIRFSFELESTDNGHTLILESQMNKWTGLWFHYFIWDAIFYMLRSSTVLVWNDQHRWMQSLAFFESFMFHVKISINMMLNICRLWSTKYMDRAYWRWHLFIYSRTQEKLTVLQPLIECRVNRWTKYSSNVAIFHAADISPSFLNNK